MNHISKFADPSGDHFGGSSDVGRSTFNRPTASTRMQQNQRPSESAQTLAKSKMHQQGQHAGIAQNNIRSTVLGKETQPVRDPNRIQQMPVGYDGIDDARNMMPVYTQNPSQQIQAQIYHSKNFPRQVPQQYQGLHRLNPQQQSDHFTSLGVGGMGGVNGPQIQLSQRQMELLAARNHMQQQQHIQQQQQQAQNAILYNAARISVPEKQAFPQPVFLSRSNIAGNTMRQDPPEKLVTPVRSRMDPPSAASVIMGAVEEKNEENLSENISRSPQQQKAVPSTSRSNSSEKQRMFLRTLLQKSGTHSIASTSTSNKASKALMKKVLQKGASHLSVSKTKYTLSKSNSAIKAKNNINLPNREIKTVGSGNSLRERWFKKKGAVVALVDSSTISLSLSSDTSSSVKDSHATSKLSKRIIDQEELPTHGSRKEINNIVGIKQTHQSPGSLGNERIQSEKEVLSSKGEGLILDKLKDSMPIESDNCERIEQNSSTMPRSMPNTPSKSRPDESVRKPEFTSHRHNELEMDKANRLTTDDRIVLSKNDAGTLSPSETSWRKTDMQETKKVSSTNEFEEGYDLFAKSLENEVFSGQFTQLWDSFSFLLLGNNLQEDENIYPSDKEKIYKVDDHTKQILKELNHHAKKYSNVECMPRSQLVNDKKYFQEFPDKKIRLNQQNQRLANFQDPILIRRSSSSDEQSSASDSSLSHPSLHLRDIESAISEKHSEVSTSPKLFQEIQRKKQILSIPPALTANLSEPSIPWLDKRDILKPVEYRNDPKSSTEKITNQYSKYDTRVSPERNSNKHQSESFVHPHTQAKQNYNNKNVSPPWTKVTLRHVMTPDRFRNKDEFDDNLSAANSSHSTTITEIVDASSRSIFSVNSNDIDDVDDNVTSTSSGEGVKDNISDGGSVKKDRKTNSVVIIRLEDSSGNSNESRQHVESRIIVGKSTLMRVQSLKGESQAAVEWKLSRTEVDSMSLDIANRRVNLLLFPHTQRSNRTFTLIFERQEDCVRFTDAFYEMSPASDEDPEYCDDTTCATDSLAPSTLKSSQSYVETVDSVSKMESLNDEEQNVLETYRRLRQTKAADEALNESISENQQPKISKSFSSVNILTETEEETTSQYRKMLNLSIPIDNILLKMKLDGVDAKIVKTITEEASTAPPQYVMPPDLPSSPVSTFSNSVCTFVTADDEVVAEKYRKMLRLKIPFDAVEHKMKTDNVDPKIMAMVLGNKSSEEEFSNHKTPSAEAEQIICRYKKMMKLGLPEEAVRHKMKQDQVVDENIINAVFNLVPEKKENLTEDEEATLQKYQHFLKIGMPEDAVRHKMEKDNIDSKLIAMTLGKNAGSDNTASEKDPPMKVSASNKSLTMEEESVASKFKKMLKVQIPKDLVLSRMEKEGISKNIISSVVGDLYLISKSREKQGTSEERLFPSSSSLTGSNLINIHWSKISGQAIPGSVWDKVNMTDASNDDFSELCELFQKKVTNTTGRNGEKSSDDSSCNSNAKVKLLDLTRSNNIAISLKAFKEFTYIELANIIAFVNPQRKIQGERAHFIRDLLPTSSEIKIIESYNGTDDRLVPAELWFSQLIGIKRIETKVQVIRTMEMFSAEADAVRANFQLLSKICRQVIDSERLKILLQAVLIIGNKLNEGTRNGAAAGFRFDSLLRLTQTKASDGKTTALDYLVKEFTDKGQREILSLTADFPDCQTASRMLLSDMTNEVKILENALEQCRAELLTMKEESNKDVSNAVIKSVHVVTLANNLEKKVANQMKAQYGKHTQEKNFSSSVIDVESHNIGSCSVDDNTENQRCPSFQNSISGGIQRLSAFLDSVETLFDMLKNERDVAIQACKDLAKYSGESGGISATTTILGVLSEFASNIESAIKKYDENQLTAARKQKALESKEIKSALIKINSERSSVNGNGKSLIFLVNDILKNANPQFKEDFKKGRVVLNPSETLKAVYEREKTVEPYERAFNKIETQFVENTGQNDLVVSSKGMKIDIHDNPPKFSSRNSLPVSIPKANELVSHEEVNDESSDCSNMQSEVSKHEKFHLSRSPNNQIDQKEILETADDILDMRDISQKSVSPDIPVNLKDDCTGSSVNEICESSVQQAEINEQTRDRGIFDYQKVVKMQSAILPDDCHVTEFPSKIDTKIAGIVIHKYERDITLIAHSSDEVNIYPSSTLHTIEEDSTHVEKIEVSKSNIIENLSIGALVDPDDEDTNNSTEQISIEQEIADGCSTIESNEVTPRVSEVKEPFSQKLPPSSELAASVQEEVFLQREKQIESAVSTAEVDENNKQSDTFDSASSAKRIQSLKDALPPGAKRTVSDVVKSLKKYSESKNVHDTNVHIKGLRDRKSLPILQQPLRHEESDIQIGLHKFEPKRSEAKEVFEYSHKSQYAVDTVHKLETHVGRMARLKREEKGRAMKMSKELEVDNPASNLSESAMARLARQKRINKRMTR